MLKTFTAQPMRSASADVRDRRLSAWLTPPLGIPDEHHHSHPRYKGLHLVTTDEGSDAHYRSPQQISTTRRFFTACMSAFWGSDPNPRRLRRSARA